MKNRPKVGVAAIIVKNGKVLLGKRKVRMGKGDWAFPGGHLEFNEAIEDAVKREVREETDLSVSHITFQAVTNDIREVEKTHYITLFFTAKYTSGKVKNMEPHKCENWEWFEWDKLPNPLFLPIKNLLKQNFRP